MATATKVQPLPLIRLGRASEAFDDRFQNAWVKIGSVNGWVASSYHIKVAVRDRKAIWLSSGNWQSSNQPAIDPLNERPRQRTHLTKYNREWHAIVEHEGLARIYEVFLDNDLEQNLKLQPQEGLELPDLLVPDAVLLPALEARKRSTFEYFVPFDETRRFRVEPLLTPDNYHARVLELIRSAERELFIQNQTFNAPGDALEIARAGEPTPQGMRRLTWKEYWEML